MSRGWRTEPMSPAEFRETIDGCLLFVGAPFLIAALCGLAAVFWMGIERSLGEAAASIATIAAVTLIALAARHGPRWHHVWECNRYMAWWRQLQDDGTRDKARMPIFVRFWGEPACGGCGARHDDAPFPDCDRPAEHLAAPKPA